MQPIQGTVNAAFADEMAGDPRSGQPDYVALEPARDPHPDQPSVIALPVPRPYSGWGRITKGHLAQSQPDVVAAWLQWLFEESGWTVADPEEGYELMSEMMDSNWEDSMFLNMVAWTVATDESLKTRDLGLALKAARRANELTGEKSAAVLDTVARVYYEQGDLAAAVEWQRMAIEALTEEDERMMGDDVRKMLEQYEKEAAE